MKKTIIVQAEARRGKFCFLSHDGHGDQYDPHLIVTMMMISQSTPGLGLRQKGRQEILPTTLLASDLHHARHCDDDDEDDDDDDDDNGDDNDDKRC